MGEGEKMKAKVLALVIPLLVVLMLSPPVFAVKGPVMDELHFKFYGTQPALYTGLLADEIDFMGWSLTKAQYDEVKLRADITVAPYFDIGMFDMGFNNNYTAAISGYETFRNPFNYKEFRQAVACLIDKDGLIAGPELGGFGERIDTAVARPIHNDWVNFSVSKYGPNGELLDNYPWDYNVYKALEILYTNGWYDTTTYPTLDALKTAYDTGALTIAAGEPSKAIYPAGHEKAGLPVDALVGYIRNDHPPRLAAGKQLTDALRSIGIQVDAKEGPSGYCYFPVFRDRAYHFYTSGWSLGARPLHFYALFTPVGIYPFGPNFYMIDNPVLTHHAILQYPNSTSVEMSMSEAKIIQGIMVENAHHVPLYSSRSYYAYRTGILSVAATRGYGLTTALDYVFLAAYHKDYPTVNRIRYGTMRPPEAVNPIFSSWLWDYEVIDRMFTSYLILNPYKPHLAGKSPVGGDQPWMAYDWKYELGADGNAIVTLWFRSDIKWHDGTPFTVDDLNYTIYLGATYDDSWPYTDMMHVIGFEKIDNWTCKLYFDWPSYWSVYTAGYAIIPKHIYEQIPIKPYPATDGHRGFWPGEHEIKPGTDRKWLPEETWVGTNMWKYRPGTLVRGLGGGLVLEAFDGFWMKMMPGDIDFTYFWRPGSPPQGGEYKIGLPDLVLLANAYGTSGTGVVPFKEPGVKGAWNPAADLAAPAGVIGLSDLVTLARNYGKTWGTNP